MNIIFIKSKNSKTDTKLSEIFAAKIIEYICKKENLSDLN